MRIVKRNRFKNLGELPKEWTEAGLRHQEPSHTDVSRNWLQFVIQRHPTWAKDKKNWTVVQWSNVLFSDESKFCISLYFTKVLESGRRVEKLIAQVAWSPVLNFHSLWWFGCNVICRCWSIVCFWKPTSLRPFTNTFWSTLCFLLLTSFLKMLISFSSRIWHLPTLPKSTNSWLKTMVFVCLTSQQTPQTWTP